MRTAEEFESRLREGRAPLLKAQAEITAVLVDSAAIASFVERLNAGAAGAQNPVRHELLKYHRLGLPKYEALGREYPLGEVSLSDAGFARCKEYVYAK